MKLAALLLAIAGFATQIQSSFAASVATKSAKEKERARIAKICGASHPSLNNRGYKIYDALKPISGERSLKLKTSPQHQAMCWIIHKDKAGVSKGSKLVERYALATLYHATKPEVWNTDTNWLTNESVCNWYGITCDSFGHVVDVDLGFNALNGIVPSEVGWLMYLEGLRLTANDLQGVLPHSIGNLKKLKVLQINMNGFFGSLPRAIGKMSNLRELHVYGNYFDGTLPKEVGLLKNLEIFDIYANFFKGNLPSELGKLTKLKSIFLNDNDLRGTIPTEICNLNLEFFVSDCRGYSPEVTCRCCTHCCKDGADPKCEKMEVRTNTKKK